MLSPRCAKKSIIQYRDRRKADRDPKVEDLQITLCDPSRRRISVKLKDLRNYGFSIEYVGDTLPAGTEFLYEGGVFRGRARVMWSRNCAEQNEGGCVVVLD